MSRERGGSTLAGAGRVCPLCSGVDKVPVIEVPPWKVSECPRCRLGFLDPPLSSEQVSALYDQTFYYDNRMVADANDAKKAVAAQRPRVRYLQRVRRSGRLLEIGAGMGYLLAAARDAGFNATGLELSPWAAGQARDVLGLQVVVGGVETAPFTPESFDMIVCGMSSNILWTLSRICGVFGAGCGRKACWSWKRATTRAMTRAAPGRSGTAGHCRIISGILARAACGGRSRPRGSPECGYGRTTRA